MLYLVEGLNCSGKTTYINNLVEHKLQGYQFNTGWANPLRQVNLSKRTIMNNNYLCGVYEAVWHSYKTFANFGDAYYWDRTWISAYVYGSINLQAFDRLCRFYKGCTIIYIDTPMLICKERWEKLRNQNPNYKKYVGDLRWYANDDDMKVAIKRAQLFGLKVERVSGC